MLGAIVGDIVGSIYEFNNIKTKDFPLFREKCFFTDDTVMTVATAEAIMNGGKECDFINAYKKWGRLYPAAGYGCRFKSWLISKSSEAYNSWGNGSAMRVSPCGYCLDYRYYKNTKTWKPKEWNMVTNSAMVTHSHPEGVKGAQVVSAIIAFCLFYFHRNKRSDPIALNECKLMVRRIAEEEFGYDLSKTLDEIRPNYRFSESCQNTVPQAIIAFLESTNFEDAIRNAISLGGDSDTLAAITGSIAEAVYGIPLKIKEETIKYLDGPILDVYRRWNRFLRRKSFITRVECLAHMLPRIKTIYK